MLRSQRKNLLSLMAVLLIAMLLSACGATGGSPAQTTNPGTTPAPAAPEPTPATNFPTKPIRLIITHGAGGSTDSFARLAAPYVSQALGGNPVVVENMPGAGGNISRAYVYNQEPDGYTLLVSQFPSMLIGEVVQNGQFKTLEMNPVAQMTGKQTQAIVVPASHPVKSFEELVAYSKTNPVNMGGPGLGTNGHLVFALMGAAGVKGTYIPFNSAAETLTAVTGAQVDVGTADSTALPSLVEEGRIRVLVATSLERDSNIPDTPTLIELGHPGMGFEISIGVVAPPNVPADVMKVLHDAFKTALTDPDLVSKAGTAGYSVTGLVGDEFGSRIVNDYKLVEGFKDLLTAK